MKYDLDRTGMKKIDKNGKNCMPRNVAQDALPGSATLYVFRTAGLTTALHNGNLSSAGVSGVVN